MTGMARRVLSRPCEPFARRAWRALRPWLAVAGVALVPAIGAQAAPDPQCIGAIQNARFVAPTDRYPHAVLGNELEWGALRINVSTSESVPAACRAGGYTLTVTLPDELVFEDLAPRLSDLDGDGAPEVIVVESHRDKGARLAVWGIENGRLSRLAATPFIGTRFRWLAPVGAADLDGDGKIEIAYVDRPHLAKILRVWRFDGGKLIHVADRHHLTNHKIGWDFIPGGIRHCADGTPEIITALGDWKLIVATRLGNDGLSSVGVDVYRGPESLDAALDCP